MFDPQPYLEKLFYRLRSDGFNLSINEYFAVLDALKAGWGTKDKADFQKLLFLVWCKSYEQQSHLGIVFESIVRETDTTPKQTESRTEETLETSNQERINAKTTENLASPSPIQTPVTTVTKPATQALSSLPIKTPQIIEEYEDDSELVTHYPISRRFMVYAWRYLRRPVADGIRDVLDVSMTVEEATKQGFYLQPVYARREQNHAHLLILVDQEGSMTPFHHFSRDLVETALYESSLERVDVVYFHNLPAEYVYRDPFLTDKIALESVLSQCDSETRVLMISDGGAARGYRRRERISATTEVIWEIQQQTNLIAWLNPVPQPRWNSTSAQIIAHLVPMFSMNREGLIQAIATLQR